jgi:hypothetical protein
MSGSNRMASADRSLAGLAALETMRIPPKRDADLFIKRYGSFYKKMRIMFKRDADLFRKRC